MTFSRLALIATFAAMLSACSNATQSFQPSGSAVNAPVTTVRSIDSWRFTLAQKQLPSAGCFKVAYPSTQWDRVDCFAAPSHWHSLPSSAGGDFAQTVGRGYDFTADTAPNLISKAIGAFPKVEGVKRVRSAGCCGVEGRDSYTLQLNSNFFRRPPAVAFHTVAAGNSSFSKTRRTEDRAISSSKIGSFRCRSDAAV